jgi:molecular chaperone DnaJ
MSDNHYEILELSQDCKQEEIDKAYKKLALRYHPDRNPGDSECASKFVKIQQAYDVLKDPAKRRMYDMQSQGGAMPHFAHMHMHDMEDLNIKMSSMLTFEDSVLGTKKTISIFRKEPCFDCAGEGHKSFNTCPLCNGRGSTIAQFGGMIQFATMCPNCHGRGKLGVDKCKTCNASKYLTGSETQIEIAFPAGIINGMTLSVNGAGHKGKNGNQGNILVQCNIVEQKKYSLKGLDIFFNFEVAFSTMLFGGTIEIPTFENDLIEINIPARTQNLTNFRIKGKGMPAINNKMLRGDLVAVVITKVPTDTDFIPELQGILEHHGI